VETLKVLGQSAPSATTATTLYTVPASVATVGSSLVVCNRGADGTFRIAVRPAGATLANEHYLFYDTEIDANSTLTLVIGITLATTDVITVYASSGDFSFTLFGSEVDV
jgi:hypothetical protein